MTPITLGATGYKLTDAAYLMFSKIYLINHKTGSLSKDLTAEQISSVTAWAWFLVPILLLFGEPINVMGISPGLLLSLAALTCEFVAGIRRIEVRVLALIFVLCSYALARASTSPLSQLDVALLYLLIPLPHIVAEMPSRFAKERAVKARQGLILASSAVLAYLLFSFIKYGQDWMILRDELIYSKSNLSVILLIVFWFLCIELNIKYTSIYRAAALITALFFTIYFSIVIGSRTFLVCALPVLMFFVVQNTTRFFAAIKATRGYKIRGRVVFAAIITITALNVDWDSKVDSARIMITSIGNLIILKNQSIETRKDYSVVARSSIYEDVWVEREVYGLFGNGPGSYRFVQYSNFPVGKHPESSWLILFIDYGLLGILSWSALLLASLRVFRARVNNSQSTLLVFIFGSFLIMNAFSPIILSPALYLLFSLIVPYEVSR
jgi:hypothetical protein